MQTGAPRSGRAARTSPKRFSASRGEHRSGSARVTGSSPPAGRKRTRRQRPSRGNSPASSGPSAANRTYLHHDDRLGRRGRRVTGPAKGEPSLELWVRLQGARRPRLERGSPRRIQVMRKPTREYQSDPPSLPAPGRPSPLLPEQDRDPTCPLHRTKTRRWARPVKRAGQNEAPAR